MALPGWLIGLLGKRTVEGDLGVYLNASHILSAAGDINLDLRELRPMPDNERARQIAIDLTRLAVDIAIWRHAGALRAVYGAQGRRERVQGRDLTAIRYIVGTGGALTRLGMGETILTHLRADPGEQKLLPPADARVLLDRHYIMAACGVLSQQFPEAARRLLLDSLDID